MVHNLLHSRTHCSVAKAELTNKKMKKEDLSLLPEELKLKSDLEIHLFCKNYDVLHGMCLTDGTTALESNSYIYRPNIQFFW